MINYKLHLFTPCNSYGAKEMAPKSQLCACSFQDSLRQKNWALEQIRKFPDTIRYVWTAENDLNTLRVGAKIFASAKKYLRKKKFPDTCGHGLRSLLIHGFEMILLESQHHTLQTFQSTDETPLKDAFQRLMICFDLDWSSLDILFQSIKSKYNSKKFFLNLCIVNFCFGHSP